MQIIRLTFRSKIRYLEYVIVGKFAVCHLQLEILTWKLVVRPAETDERMSMHGYELCCPPFCFPPEEVDSFAVGLHPICKPAFQTSGRTDGRPKDIFGGGIQKAFQMYFFSFHSHYPAFYCVAKIDYFSDWENNMFFLFVQEAILHRHQLAMNSQEACEKAFRAAGLAGAERNCYPW